MAATVASKVNGCIYCASVHARKAAQLSKREAEIDRLLAVAPGGALSQGQDDAWQAQITFAAALSATPPQADAGQLAALRAQAWMSWRCWIWCRRRRFSPEANRLMLTLGEPYL